MPKSSKSFTSRDCPPAESFGGTLRVLSEALNGVFHAEIDRYGVTSGQWRFLRELWYEDGISQAELAGRVGRKGPTTGTALKLLMRNGLARCERSSHDLRKNKVFLTKKGRALEAQLLPFVAQFDALVTRCLSAEEVVNFRDMVRRVRESIDEFAGMRWTELGAVDKQDPRARSERRVDDKRRVSGGVG